MVKVIVYPPTSMILSDLVERMGHEALVLSKEMRKLVTSASLESPPLNITPENPKKGLKYAAVDVPSGIRGRMSLLGPMIDEAEAALVVNDENCLVGCTGCARTNELVRLLIKTKGIPYLELKYPRDDGQARRFVHQIRTFLEGLS
ncbi:MAG: methanogenesis marker 5 protein [Methanotrichaceae archaeon]|nr:methanogenesis marker 5 protein [Methanotrichaceae archaeon]